jgi:hypothetical protein
MERREEVETKLGVPSDVEPETRPVYGTLGGTGMRYGDTTVTFDDSLKDRTTVTVGDSIDGAVNGYFNLGELAAGNVSRDEFWNNVGERVSRWSGNSYVSTWFNYTGDFQISGYAGVKDIYKLGANGYIEAQFHGGLKLSDVSSITVNPDAKISGGNQSKLDSLGITVNRVQSDWTKD